MLFNTLKFQQNELLPYDVKEIVIAVDLFFIRDFNAKQNYAI
jgi:hypothetical protein